MRPSTILVILLALLVLLFAGAAVGCWLAGSYLGFVLFLLLSIGPYAVAVQAAGQSPPPDSD